MMDARIEARTYGALLPTRKEILRYAGLGKAEDAQVEALLEEALTLSHKAHDEDEDNVYNDGSQQDGEHDGLPHFCRVCPLKSPFKHPPP